VAKFDGEKIEDRYSLRKVYGALSVVQTDYGGNATNFQVNLEKKLL